MIKKHLGLIAASALVLAACDVVRVPGDGREAPEIPDGAPGPMPPTDPVPNPYGDDEPGETADTSPTEDTETPVIDTETETDSDTDTEATDTEDPVTDDTETTDTDPEDTGPTEETEPETDTEVSDPPATDDTPEAPVEPVEDDSPVSPPPPQPVKFEYYAPGDISPGTGTGRADDTVYAPNIVFPIKSDPTFPQSMVFRPGGAVGGDQCDPANFSTPWRDNFCERRSSTRNTPMCPTNKVHQGQDIRVGTAADCNAMRRQDAAARGLHEVVAVEDGIIQHIGTYSVQLKGTETGNIYSYLHLNMRRLRVSEFDTVEAGDTLGFVSNDFGGTPTTYHLHFEIKAPIEGEGIVHVPPYMSLVAAYERREGGVGKLVEDDTVAVASLPVIVDESKLIE